LVIGAPAYDSGAGAIYSFVNTGTEFVEQDRFVVSEIPDYFTFGNCISITNDSTKFTSLNFNAFPGGSTGPYAGGAVELFQLDTLGNIVRQDPPFRLPPEGTVSTEPLGNCCISGDGSRVFLSQGNGNGPTGAWPLFQPLPLPPAGPTGLQVRIFDITSVSPTACTGTESPASPILNPLGPSVADAFGQVIKSNNDGSIIAVGCNSTIGSGQGIAYVFRCSGVSCIQETIVELSGGETGPNRFGRYLDISDSGNAVAIGAPGFDADKGDIVGRAYVYEYEGGVWSGTELITSSSKFNFGYGISISPDGRRVCVSAGASAPQVSIFCKFENLWLETSTITPSVGTESFYGRLSVQSSNILAVSASGNEAEGVTKAGEVFVYDFESITLKSLTVQSLGK